jgi:hypothetical protein
MTKRFAVLSLLTLSWTIIGDWQPEPSHSAKAISTASAFGQQPAPAASSVTWEYRILLGNTFHIASLESSINKLTEQGFTVETFHPLSSVSGGRGPGNGSALAVNSTTEIFVLLRRIRR